MKKHITFSNIDEEAAKLKEKYVKLNIDEKGNVRRDNGQYVAARPIGGIRKLRYHISERDDIHEDEFFKMLACEDNPQKANAIYLSDSQRVTEGLLCHPEAPSLTFERTYQLYRIKD